MSQAESQSLFQEMTSRLKSPVSDKFCNMYTGCQVSGIKGNQQIELDCKPQKEKSLAQKHVHHALMLYKARQQLGWNMKHCPLPQIFSSFTDRYFCLQHISGASSSRSIIVSVSSMCTSVSELRVTYS